MALTKCPECGNEVSDTCKNCIHCGYALHIEEVPEKTTVKTKRKAGFGGRVRKHKILIIVILAVAILAVALIAVFSVSGNHDPFEVLYFDQTREGVRMVLGMPDRVIDKNPKVSKTRNIDEYHDIKFLRGTGTLKIWYYDDYFISNAVFYYDYPVSDPSSKDRDEAREYALSIIDFFTKKYGPSEKGYYDYEWRLPDYSEIGMDVDLSPEKLEYVIEIAWN